LPDHGRRRLRGGGRLGSEAMHRIRTAALASALLAGLSGAAAAAPVSDQAQIRALEDRFAAAFRAKDVDRIMGVYAPGTALFVFDVVPPRQYAGALAYRKDWSDLLGAFTGPVKVEISDLVIDTAGSVGWSHSIQHVSGQGANGQPVDMTVRVTDVYRKEAGSWRIVQEHVSVPVDITTGKADLASSP
jgi:ketosteroid isomerase-like protein